jgi:hypothetical protein
MAAVFAFLKFGQPTAIKLKGNEYMLVNWFIEEGQGKILKIRFSVEGI